MPSENEKLPETHHLWYQIFLLVDQPQTLAVCARVCKSWFAQSVPILWHGSLGNDSWHSPPTHFMLQLAKESPARFASYLRHIRILHISVVTHARLIARWGPQMSAEVWRSFNGSILFYLVRYNHEAQSPTEFLKVLLRSSLHGVYMYKGYRGLNVRELIKDLAPNLRVLVDETKMETDTGTVLHLMKDSKLEYLDICAEIQAEHLQLAKYAPLVKQKATQLKRLDLSFVNGLQMVPDLLKSIPHLLQLNLSVRKYNQIDRPNDCLDLLDTIIDTFADMEDLSILFSDCKVSTRIEVCQRVLRLFTRFTQLRTFHFEFCSPVDQYGADFDDLITAVSRIQNLQALCLSHFFGESRVRPEQMRRLLRNCPALTELYLPQCFLDLANTDIDCSSGDDKNNDKDKDSSDRNKKQHLSSAGGRQTTNIERLGIGIIYASRDAVEPHIEKFVDDFGSLPGVFGSSLLNSFAAHVDEGIQALFGPACICLEMEWCQRNLGMFTHGHDRLLPENTYRHTRANGHAEDETEEEFQNRLDDAAADPLARRARSFDDLVFQHCMELVMASEVPVPRAVASDSLINPGGQCRRYKPFQELARRRAAID